MSKGTLLKKFVLRYAQKSKKYVHNTLTQPDIMNFDKVYLSYIQTTWPVQPHLHIIILCRENKILKNYLDLQII